ncbi:MAG: 50S ribosomal protein L29 [Bacteroidota bacterium]|nr:50S ribosomal protein L29 [Bacteroidota bacterium]MDE2835646.1 50S ribosomal protein L29 [Bacteroidota bacterium]MDE2956424.1 50S ribosomal protein L29 [Bacteroidota bacterium]
MMKAKDIRALGDVEIRERIRENTQELRDLRFNKAIAGLENPLILRRKRRFGARLKTILKERTG